MIQEMPIIEEQVRLGEGGRLAGVLHYPAEAAPRRAILLCSPHPNFAGDMENNVILALAKRLSSDGVVLRFDYRGVGQSRIELPEGVSEFDYWDQVEQNRDYRDPLADTAAAADELRRICGELPMTAVGYSFGAVTATLTALGDGRFDAMAAIAPPLQRIEFDFLAGCPKRCLVISGEGDFVYDAAVAARLAEAGGPRLALQTLKGFDHFFRGDEAELAERVSAFLEASCPAA